mmetsp:Transcript_84054/g.116116  ORF Transcript_84054/g.116116 Transcript_84054/m.116116 type:complete len:388 (+) Transcript_84054:482-1645(+)
MSSVFVYTRVVTLQWFSWYATKKMHEDMISRVLNAPINLYFDTTPTGRILNKFSKDLSAIETMLVYLTGTFYVSLYSTISILVISIFVVWWIIFFVPIIVYLVYRVFKRSIAGVKDVTRVESVSKSPLLSFLGETISGASTIRSYDKVDGFISRNMELLNNNILASMWCESIPLWFAIRIDIISVFMMLIVSLICVIYRNSGHAVVLSLLLTYVMTLQQFVSSIIRNLMQIEARMVNVDRCLKVLDIPQENTAGKMELERFKRLNPEWPDHGEIIFDNVILKYRPTTEIVLNNLSFDVAAGEKIGVVGRTGAGKSTICLSLSRIVEIVSGSIKIDGINIREVELNYLRSRITVIPQDPTMFTGTLRFNLDPENQVSDDRIYQVLESA